MQPATRRVSLVLTVGAFCGGCAGARGSAAPAARAPEPERIELPRMVVTPKDATALDELFRRAEAAYQAQQYEAAAQDYDRIYEIEPRGVYAEHALFFAGSAYDLGAHPKDALSRYEAFIGRYPRGALVRTAWVRSARLYAYFEEWQRAGRTADSVLARYKDLRPFELIALYGAKALSLVRLGKDDEASYYVEKARTVIEDHRLDAAGQIPRDLALVYYALGEVRRLRAERIKFVPVPDDFAQTLEARCQLILDAQTSYSDTMRAHDAHWSAMAGYRVGELYQSLHEDLMQVPPPKSAEDQSRRQLFAGAMRLRYSILLEKAHSMMEHTLRMAERTGEQSAWIGKARSSLIALDDAMKKEQEALDDLPYTRQQLQDALDDLSRRKSTTRSPRGVSKIE